MNKKKILKAIVSLLIISIILFKIDIDSLLTVISQFKIWVVIPVLSLLITVLLVNSYNLRFLFLGINEKKPFLPILSSYISAWIFGKVTTGKSGELSIIYFLKKKKFKLESVFFVIILDKIITMIVLLIIAFIAALILFKENTNIIWIAFLVFITSCIILILAYDKIRELIKKYILRKYSIYFKGFNIKLNLILGKNKKFLAWNFLFTIIKQFNISIPLFIIMWGLGIYVNPLLVFLISGIESIASQIPISLSGIGVSEGTAIIFYSLIGVSSHIVLSAYIINRMIGYSASLIIYLSRLFIKVR